MTGNSNGAKFERFSPFELGIREWGTELLVSHIPNKCTGKLIYIDAGKKGGLQKHKEKDEAIFVFSGHLKLRYDNGKGKLIETVMLPGDAARFPPGLVHQEEAITDCIIFEVSSPHFNDRVRMEEFYGENQKNGLPSTEGPEASA